jgi:ATP/maltotriose-dependent transcriptional regulator MalT
MRCSVGTRELAKLVAITPGRCEIWLIESILGTSGNAVDEAVILGLLEAQADAVSFRHELARLAVLSAIPPHRLRAMHAQVLERFVEHSADAAKLVHHAALAENGAAVLEYAPIAAEKASRLGAHREAAVHLGLALRYGTTLTQALRADFLERHAQESALANQAPEAIASAMAAVASWRELGDVQSQSRVLCLLSQEYRTVGNTRGADECAAAAISLLEELPRSAGLAMAYGARALLAVNRGRNREALEFGKRALKLAREVGDSAAESHALCHIGGALLGAGDHAGYEPLERSLALALDQRLDDHAARAYRTLQFYAGMNHDFARADQAFHEGVEYCEERGIFSHSAYLRAYFTVCELDRGRWTDAAGAAAELMRSSEVFGVTQRVTVMTTLAVVRLRRGDPGVDELLDPALALALPTGEASRIARVTAARAEQAWYSGRLADVAQETAIGLSHLRGDTTPWLNGELLFWQSRVQSIGTDVGAIAEPWRLMLAEEWRTAAAAWQRIGMPYEQALALAEGNEEDVRDALSIFDRLGAAPMAAIVRRRLRAEGIRDVPRGAQERTRNNPHGLTGRELKVLSLLTSGQRNADIARQLFVSDKTIEHHVSAILAKLGVRSRGEAAAAANKLGLLTAGMEGPTPKK